VSRVKGDGEAAATPDTFQEGDMSRESDHYPTLMGLNRGYFNQDVDVLVSADPDEVINTFKNENAPEFIEQTVQEVRRFLSAYGQNDSDLTSAFERIFKPEVAFYNMKGRTTRQGLEKLVEILSNLPGTP
jgi:predicted nucleotidyltransferase